LSTRATETAEAVERHNHAFTVHCETLSSHIRPEYDQRRAATADELQERQAAFDAQHKLVEEMRPRYEKAVMDQQLAVLAGIGAPVISAAAQWYQMKFKEAEEARDRFRHDANATARRLNELELLTVEIVKTVTALPAAALALEIVQRITTQRRAELQNIKQAVLSNIRDVPAMAVDLGVETVLARWAVAAEGAGDYHVAAGGAG
jgi:hypothetical protein